MQFYPSGLSVQNIFVQKYLKILRCVIQLPNHKYFLVFLLAISYRGRNIGIQMPFHCAWSNIKLLSLLSLITGHSRHLRGKIIKDTASWFDAINNVKLPLLEFASRVSCSIAGRGADPWIFVISKFIYNEAHLHRIPKSCTVLVVSLVSVFPKSSVTLDVVLTVGACLHSTISIRTLARVLTAPLPFNRMETLCPYTLWGLLCATSSLWS